MEAAIIQLRGVITSALYDDEVFADYIDKGIITPSSKVLRELYRAEKAKQPVRLIVNSPGGDALAANDIINAVRKFKGDLSIEIGAFAASAAANLILQANRPTTCYRNTIVLWHSAWSTVEGGPQHMRDEARMLDLINRPIREGLARHGVPEPMIATGFNEGRALTMGADELAQYGIVSGIVDEDAEPLQADPASRQNIVAAMANAKLTGYLPVAAFEGVTLLMTTETTETTPEHVEASTTENAETVENVEASTPATPENVEASPSTDPADPAPLAEQLATLRAELASANAALKAALDRCETMKVERDQYAHDADSYQTKLVDAIAARDKAIAEKAKLIGSVMATPTDARAEFAAIGSAEKRLAYFAQHRAELATATR